MADITTSSFGFFDWQTGDDDTYAYTAAEFCDVINMICGTGIIYGKSSCFKPTISGSTLTIATGFAVIQGHYCALTTNATLDCSSLSGSYYICFVVDETNRVVKISTLSADPGDNTCICKITVSNGSITALYDFRNYIYQGSDVQSCPVIYSSSAPSSPSTGTIWLKPVSLT